MRVFLSGGTGFIGGRVAAQLRSRGDQVICLVRDPAKAQPLSELGCELITGDLGDKAALRAGCEGAEAAIHAAAIYEVGIRARDRGPVWEANVVGTENFMKAAQVAGVPRVVYVSTVAVFGNTHGQVVPADFSREDFEFTSYYEETKYRAHALVQELIDDAGLPVVIAQPGSVYGPGDHSSIGKTLRQFADGRMPAVPFPDLGMTMVHVDDVATGLLLCLDRGQTGRSYVLGGEIIRMRDLIGTAARLLGRRPPRLSVPTGMLKALKPFGPLVGAGMGQPPNLGELISSADGVTFWADSDRAILELGYSPRSLDTGLRDTFAAEGRRLETA